MSLDPSAEDRNLLDDLFKKAKARGADGADGMLARSTSLSHAQRLGEIEKIEREESFDLGLRVFRGRKQAVVSSTDLSAEALDELVDRALAMAGTVPDDPWCGLADPDQLSTVAPVLDMVDTDEPTRADVRDSLIDSYRRLDRLPDAILTLEQASETADQQGDTQEALNLRRRIAELDPLAVDTRLRLPRRHRSATPSPWPT